MSEDPGKGKEESHPAPSGLSEIAACTCRALRNGQYTHAYTQSGVCVCRVKVCGGASVGGSCVSLSPLFANLKVERPVRSDQHLARRLLHHGRQRSDGILLLLLQLVEERSHSAWVGEGKCLVFLFFEIVVF